MKNRLLMMIGNFILLAVPASLTYILLFCPGDISANRTEGRIVFGATYMTMNNPYYQVLDIQLRSEIEERGDVLLTRDAAMNQSRQNEEIRELIEAGVQAIFLTPVEWDTSEEGLRIAARANIPVIVIDAPVRNTELTACSVLSDNYRAGALCAEDLLKTRDSANIILLEHITARSGAERIQGFLDTIREKADFERFKIVGSGESDGQIENAMPVMEKLLKQAPDADTVMALNDPSAFGALAAIEGAGLADRFLVYSVDGSPEAKALVRDELMTATCAQFPYKIAKEAAEQAYNAIGPGCERHEIIIPVELLTAETVEPYATTGWQ